MSDMVIRGAANFEGITLNNASAGLETGGRGELQPQGNAGRDRREHHRRSTRRSWIEIAGQSCWVHDISLGGMRFETPAEPHHLEEPIAGELVYQDDRTMARLPFRARIVRIEHDGQLVGAAFEPFDDEQIDALLVILSSIERAFAEAREMEMRQERRRLLLARLTRWLSIGTILALFALIGYLVAVNS